MVNSSGSVSTSKYGIYLWGDWTNDPYSSEAIAKTIIRDIDITYTNGMWRSCILLENHFNSTISDVYIRPSPNYYAVGNTVDGITLRSCMNVNLFDIRITGANIGIDCIKAPSSLIKDTATKHGTEGVCIVNYQNDFCGNGVVLGKKCYACEVSNSGFALCSKGHILENDYDDDGGAGGYHVISNCSFDASSTSVTADTNHILLARPATTIANCTFGENGAAAASQNYIRIEGTGGDSTGRADHTIITGCRFREVKNGYYDIYVNECSYHVIHGCHAQGKTGYFLGGAMSYTLYNSNLFTYTSSPGDRVNITAGSGNSGNHNMEVT
jgi:hypothetical protein